MSSKYYRGLINSLNDVKYKLQLASMTLKINENKNNISGIKNDISGINNFSDKINNNETNISDNLGLINTNTSNISDNSDLINTNTSSISNISEFILKSDKDFEKTYNIEPQKFRFNKDKHFFIIFEKEIEHDFIKNSLLFVKNNIYYKYDNLSDDYRRCQHEYNIYDDENNLIHKYLFNKDTYYEENSNILNTTEEFCIYFKKNYNKIKIVLELHRHNRHGFGNINLEIDNNNNYIKLDYIEKGFLDNSHLINLNTGSITTNSGRIDTNTSNISDNLGKININSGLINTNTSNISDNSDLINTNTSKITSNLEKITALQTSNIKAFYNLDQIFIYDIPKRDGKTVDKNIHLHIFEKEITYDFTKNSYLEITLKVLTKISNYILIGFFQILCNFYDQEDNLFYTISLSTAAGSINKLSTVKSVFIVPINKNMSKIKIDFFIAPKETQQNRSATFNIKDINSNKIYIKYFQKTEEMSIKNIQDSLNTVNNFASKIDNFEKSLYLKNIYNILIYESKTQIDFRKDIFYDKVFDVNTSINDFIEIAFKIQLEYQDTDDRHYVKMICEIFDEIDNRLYIKSVTINEYRYFSNKMLIDDNIFYNFIKDVKKLKFVIKFQKLSPSRVIKIWYIKNDNYRFILKHYGNQYTLKIYVEILPKTY